jgi:hypothetical protein
MPLTKPNTLDTSCAAVFNLDRANMPALDTSCAAVFNLDRANMPASAYFLSFYESFCISDIK